MLIPYYFIASQALLLIIGMSIITNDVVSMVAGSLGYTSALLLMWNSNRDYKKE